MTPEERNYNKIQRLLSLMDDTSLTREDFIKHFQVVIDLIKQLKIANRQEMDSLDSKYTSIVNGIKLGYSGDMAGLKSKAMDYCMAEMDKMMKAHEAKMMEMDSKMAEIKDGKDADETLIVENATRFALEGLKPLIPTIEAIEQDIPKLGQPIRDSLELLEGDERLTIEAIKDLREELDKLKKQKNVGLMAGGPGNTIGRTVTAYDLSSSLNGVLKTFSLPACWRVISVHVSSFPNILRETTDYTWTSSAITFTSAIEASTTLATGQTCIVILAE